MRPIQEPALRAERDQWERINKKISIPVGLSKAFHGQAPELVAVLENVNLSIDLLNPNLARMTKEHIDSPMLARIFFEEHPEPRHGRIR